jgi:hypothetical protein
MTISDKKEEAKDMLDSLIILGTDHRHRSDSEPPWSRADCDTILFLIDVLKNDLPMNLVSLVRQGIPSDEYDQVSFALRLERALELYNTFGNVRSSASDASSSDDLNPTFELDPDEQARVLQLSEKIRQIIFSSTVFDAPHKRRLLNRIAAVEREVHQDKGKLDVVLAGISDVGDTLKKFGGDLKPLSDRYKEIVQLTKSKSEQYEQIPPPPDQAALPPPDTDE